MNLKKIEIDIETKIVTVVFRKIDGGEHRCSFIEEDSFEKRSELIPGYTHIDSFLNGLDD